MVIIRTVKQGLVMKLTVISVGFEGGESGVEYTKIRKKSEKIREIRLKSAKICKSGPKIEGFLNPKKSRTHFSGVIHPSSFCTVQKEVAPFLDMLQFS